MRKKPKTQKQKEATAAVAEAAPVVAEGQVAPKGVWYRNAEGRLCMDGQCFRFEQLPDGFDLQFDDECDVADAGVAKGALERAALMGRLYTTKTKRKAV